MAIQNINIGTAPNSGNGETLRSAFDKVNDNFTDNNNAASRLIQTSPTDTTSGRVLTTDTDIVEAGGLGTAAKANVVTDGGDTTDGRLLKVGATVDQLDAANSNIEFIPDVSPTMDIHFAENKYRIYDGFANSFKDVTIGEVLTHARASYATGTDPILRIGTVSPDVPRLVFYRGVSKGYLSEESRTNLLTWSQDISNASWANTGGYGNLATVDVDVIQSPIIGSTASRINFNPAGTQSRRLQIVPVTAGTTYTGFAFLKKDTLDNVDLHFGIGGSTGSMSSYVSFTFSTENLVIGGVSGVVGGFEKLNDGWYMLYVTSQAYATGNTAIGFIQGLTGSVFFGGAEFEEGLFPLSYIKTEASTVTRAADSMTRTLGNDVNTSNGAIVIEGTYRIGETILSSGTWSIIADFDGYKKYAENVILDTSLTFGNGIHDRVRYYPIDFSEADLDRLTRI